MGNWGIAETAPKEEKIKANFFDLLNGLNATGAINYTVYSQLFDEFEKVAEELTQLKAEKSRGCEVCNDNILLDTCELNEYSRICGVYNECIIYNDNTYELSIRGGNLPIIQVCQKGEQCVDANILDYKITYCPNCGRKLRD